ncbi:hypothetical protein PQG44_09285 [Aquirufa sp. LEPPI-3A]|uniref:hypothetical protein n=1 Tax=Aquirufa regiilacus TaxID=3024868 RepID=UPI0028DF342D|nr:hypothetical protein [Aquirufa sp. LEPPI-3A]MDT8887869.1 hypothetical protein [Aquirufa sp. LEPPI-3A]
MHKLSSINILPWLLFALFFVSCKKDQLPIAPNVQTREAINPRAASVTLQGSNASEDLLGITERGFYYADHNKPEELLKHKVNASAGVGDFAALVTGLTAETLYSFVAFAKNSETTTLGTIKTFSTREYTLPEVSTDRIKNVYINSCQVAGIVGYDGGKFVSERGFCFSTKPNPTIQDNKVPSGFGEGPFDNLLPGLNANTSYYVKSYAINALGISYGDELNFTTNNFSPPIVSSNGVNDVTNTTANLQGEVLDNGGDNISERGFLLCPDKEDLSDCQKFIIPGNVGAYRLVVTNLKTNVLYYMRAFATNKKGTAYGAPIPFTTGDYTYASVKTVSVSDIAIHGAVLTGTVTAEGNTPVTEKGFCVSIVPNPTINNLKFPVAIGKGPFSYYLANLSENKTYYIVAYAINGKGVVYGSAISFKTKSSLPVVIIDPTSPVAPTNPSAETLKIGDFHQGGVIAYFFKETDPGYVRGEQHGFVVSPEDVSKSTYWGCQGFSITKARAEYIGSGKMNSAEIVRMCGTPNSAARLCANYTYGGYTDWFLPSKDELNQIYLQADKIGGIDKTDLYWSSTEYMGTTITDQNIAWLQLFIDGSYREARKNELYRVRAIHYF